MDKLRNVQQPLQNQSKQKKDSSSLTPPRLSSFDSSTFPDSRTQPVRKTPDVICFSHLRWDFVYQRPQHLLSRCAKDCRVFFVEEPIFTDTWAAKLEISARPSGIQVVVPIFPIGTNEAGGIALQQALLVDKLILEQNIKEYILWYYTPIAGAFTQHLEPLAVVYDCMDELSAFKNPPPGLREREGELLERADLVFTGGFNLYEAKHQRHSSIYPFPSSKETKHFKQARQKLPQPPDQAGLSHPRLGFYGVIDERFDLHLLDGLSQARPDWQFIIIGPVVKIDPAGLPRRDNIHYLGSKTYQEMPVYLSGWDIAMLPFSRNESTRFVSSTMTPEYLAAGVPVISTSIRDVVCPYGQQGLVKIADKVEDFVAAADYFMSSQFPKSAWLRQVDEALLYNSWDRTWAGMLQLINTILVSRNGQSGIQNGALSQPADPLSKTAPISQATAD